MAGYGGETFTVRDAWWFWGGGVATISGCFFGATLYDTFIFIGGESPINYAPRRRRRAKLKEEPLSSSSVSGYIRAWVGDHSTLTLRSITTHAGVVICLSDNRYELF